MQYPFGNPNDLSGYRVFPRDLEDDPLVFFHGTAQEHLASILAVGFEPTKSLESVSFATESPLALRYACESRSSQSPDGVIVVVRFPALPTKGVVVSGGVAHVYPQAELPVTVGYCIVPANYVYR